MQTPTRTRHHPRDWVRSRARTSAWDAVPPEIREARRSTRDSRQWARSRQGSDRGVPSVAYGVNSGSRFGRGSEGSGLVEGGTGSAGTFVGSSIGSMKMVRRGSPMFMLEALLHRGGAFCALILPPPSSMKETLASRHGGHLCSERSAAF